MKTLQIKVKPSARTRELIDLGDGNWQARLKSPPVDGRANAELLALVADYFDVPKSAVSLKSGASARLKIVQIDKI